MMLSCRAVTLLNTYTGEPLHVLGQLQVQVRFNNQEKTLPMVVVKGDGPSLWRSSLSNSIAQESEHITCGHRVVNVGGMAVK